MKTYKVIKSTDDNNIWHTELDNFIGQILSQEDLDYNPYICEDDWLIIKTGEYNEEDHYTMPILIHKSCLEELKVCDCPRYQVFNNGCTCGGY